MSTLYTVAVIKSVVSVFRVRAWHYGAPAVQTKQPARYAMRRVLILSVIFSVSFAALAFLGVAQAKAAEFSADMSIVPKGDEPMQGKIFVKGDKVGEPRWGCGDATAP